MLVYISKRLPVAFCVWVCVCVSAISFALMFLSGNPAIAIAGAGGRPQDAEAVRIAYGFDRAIAVQYLDWVGSAAIWAAASISTCRRQRSLATAWGSR